MPHPWCFRHSKPAGVPRPDKVRRGSSVPLTRASFQVCDCQYHFARWEDGQQAPLPCFFGAQGPQITRNLLEIEDIFHKYLNMLRAVRGGILDVKNTSWHEDYNRWGGPGCWAGCREGGGGQGPSSACGWQSRTGRSRCSDAGSGLESPWAACC